ncbi:glycosyl transferase family 2 [Burkholderia territorii]|uniref:Glycosyl transferase family 2 n=1 Tax=Burkholderia territorii TaxID=1503055 RepID=A0A108E6H5_9BURK|nr:glycosyltransferase [Burkholderia territorii]KWN05585.1 glycosyl transferase family 2 [Burkholderia territorii]
MKHINYDANRPHAYFSVRSKFLLALCVALGWAAFSVWAARPWVADLSHWIGSLPAMFAVGGIAIVPGFMNAFLVVSLLLDRRPAHSSLIHYPPVTILIAAYNEEASISETLAAIDEQRYPAPMQVIVINDGSRDRTAEVVRAAQTEYAWLDLIDLPTNVGKAAALNQGLCQARHALILTVDADSLLHGRALANIVERYRNDPPNTRAVAGAILVRNSRLNWLTRCQEWDYFVGIAAIKRMQSLYQGTLVAQGAFSLYDRQALWDVGGWASCVGEDIVLTWALLKAGYRVGHCEDAICFTNVPTTVRQFVRQRQRWARGMLEAFRQHPGILSTPRLSTFFIYWNLLFPWLDTAFSFAFMPGVVFALFGYYWIVGPMTLTLIPLAGLMSAVMVSVEKKTFRQLHLTVRRNAVGLVVYLLFYSFLLQPASVLGYLDELLKTRKTWGTK